MELKDTLDFKEKVIDFIINKHSKVKFDNISLKIIGYEVPTIFIIYVEADLYNEDNAKRQIGKAVIFYECSFNNDSKKNSELKFLIDFNFGNELVLSSIFDGKVVYHASLSPNKQFIGFCVTYKENNATVYSSFIIDLLGTSNISKIIRLYVEKSCNVICKLQFIKPPISSSVSNLSKSKRLTRNNLFSKIQNAHILFSMENRLIKYQKLLLSPISICAQNENILCSKLYLYEWKSELDRLYLLEKFNNSSRLLLKAFQLIWVIQEQIENEECEFQLLFSYEFSFIRTMDIDQTTMSDQCSFINTPRILEHSNGSICLCYVQQKDAESITYYIHLIHSENIIQCKFPARTSIHNFKIVFTIYRNYLLAITKYFIHLIDINFQTKSISNFMWPISFGKCDFSGLMLLNTVRLSKIYFIENTEKIISLSINLNIVANFIHKDYSMTENLGALNFIVYNNSRNEKTKILQSVLNNIVHSIKNSFCISRLFEEFLVTSLNRYLRLRITEENVMKYIDSTTMPNQFFRKLLFKDNDKNTASDSDFVTVSFKIIKRDALVLFVKEKLQNPQITRFFNLIRDLRNNDIIEVLKTICSINQKSQDSTNECQISHCSDVPNYLKQSLFNSEQVEELNNLIAAKLGLTHELDIVNFHEFIKKITMGFIETMKLLLIFIHKSTFSDDLNLWNDLCHLNKSSNKKLFNFHQAIGALKYTLYSKKIPIPSALNDLYLLTSYNVLSEVRFLNYIKVSDINFSSHNSIDFFSKFYAIYKSSNNKGVLEKINEIILSKIPLSNKRKLLAKFNYDDQRSVIKEYGDYANKQTGIFDHKYDEILQKISSCDNPKSALQEFYSKAINKLQ